MKHISDILTIKKHVEFKFKEKGSQFIGLAYPAETKEEAEDHLSDIKNKYYDATHHCYCYHFLDNQFKYSDDGEPNGTAGIRILNAIQHFGLTNLLVVVVRYYGGVKLGVGPLGKAYYQGAFGVLEEAAKIKKNNYSRMKITYKFDQTSQVHHLLTKFNAVITKNLYEEKPAIEFLIQPKCAADLGNELIEQTSAQAELISIEENIFI
ncbi:MAG: YigZ family protein [Ignavibacteriae bacterium]|nr:YigZ family protein [Ignavibacteriota bacterium]NOG99452.1 YigZ family protein [Ignavibacteriota bacterium]